VQVEARRLLRACQATSSLNLDVVPEADPMIDLFHSRARRLVRPRRALAACGFCRKVVELDPMRARQVALRLRRAFEQLHAHAFAGEIPVPVHFENAVAFRDDLISPYRLHEERPSASPSFAATRIATAVAPTCRPRRRSRLHRAESADG